MMTTQRHALPRQLRTNIHFALFIHMEQSVRFFYINQANLNVGTAQVQPCIPGIPLASVDDDYPTLHSAPIAQSKYSLRNFHPFIEQSLFCFKATPG
jgi:hypothetical protein